MTEAPRHQLAASALRRRSRLVLVAGSIAASLFALGGVVASWLPVVGVAVAIVSGAMALTMVWRAWALMRERADRQYQELSRRTADQLARQRSSHREIIDVLGGRIDRLSGELKDSRVQLTQLKEQVATLQSDNVDLAMENAELRTQRLVEAYESGDAEVVALPRRRVIERSDGTSTHDAVVELDLRRLSAPFVAEIVKARAI